MEDPCLTTIVNTNYNIWCNFNHPMAFLPVDNGVTTRTFHIYFNNDLPHSKTCCSRTFDSLLCQTLKQLHGRNLNHAPLNDKSR